MYGFFYAGTGQRHLPNLSFATLTDALAHFYARREIWHQVGATDDEGEFAFLNPLTGQIIIVRELNPEEEHYLGTIKWKGWNVDLYGEEEDEDD